MAAMMAGRLREADAASGCLLGRLSPDGV